MSERVQAAIDAAMEQADFVVRASGGIDLTPGAARYSIEQAISNVALVALRAADDRMGTEEYMRTCVCHGHEAVREMIRGLEESMEQAR